MSIPFSFTKTRIAPTPSGFLHLGNILSFALTATLAHKANASILLRIDDLDRERVRTDFVQDIFDTLHFLQIPWHEGPRNVDEFEKQYSQLHRMHIYREAFMQLKEKKLVFACDCSRAQLASSSPEGIYTGTCVNKQLSLTDNSCNWRLLTDTSSIVNVKNLDGTITQNTFPASMQYFVVKKKDGFPAYQLSSLLDDVYYGVDCIVRGRDLWSSTLAQLFLSEQLGKRGFQDSLFLHHPLLTEPDGGKLSKSAGATSIQYLRKHGETAASIFSMIGKMASIKTPVHDWLSLGEALLLRYEG
ncbi:MAG: glutamate--tRNA ligase family protein [Chitinophagaceae bacterium]